MHVDTSRALKDEKVKVENQCYFCVDDYAYPIKGGLFCIFDGGSCLHGVWPPRESVPQGEGGGRLGMAIVAR
eukprot:3928982-Alexandrium_andersonii.AAC.1